MCIKITVDSFKNFKVFIFLVGFNLKKQKKKLFIKTIQTDLINHKFKRKTLFYLQKIKT